ncbi:threonine/homoserine efflux transporter RhtA [Luteibacter rhizovicinus]|uniref:Threonine/homoserine efflux transporter RhtA n=1 Tax=Luteibacter rhizovicinus TaxID=242606 RepID=A0A4R3YIE0_9GAMM|nr:EamA family transporter [Luteibacter rhizovicinus]TCV92425.1 threonine/homoserine efflux transporter RhtA [Luteibacter rhizovicinus]
MNEDSPRRNAVVALGITVVIWAYSWIVMKQVLRYAGPFDFAALRYSLGAALLFGVLLATRQPLRPPPILSTALVGLSQTAAFQGLGQLALVSGGAGHVALLAYAMPFWAVLLAWVLLDERPTRRHVVGLLLAALGLTCVIEPWHGLGSTISTICALAGGGFWALGTVLSKRIFRMHNPAPLTLTAWQMMFGAIALVVVALCVPQREIDWTPAFLGGLAYSVILASSVAWGLWLFVVKRLSTAVASVASLAVPVTSVLMAWVILGERPTPMEGVGVVFILAGLVAVTGVGFGRRAGRS